MTVALVLTTLPVLTSRRSTGLMAGGDGRLTTADSIGGCNTLMAAMGSRSVADAPTEADLLLGNAEALMWDRWQRGESLQQIADLFDRHHSAIAGVLARSGGIRPPRRQRAQRALRLAEREEISRSLVPGQSIRSIAARLGLAPSTISRELRRNRGPSQYRAVQAEQAAWDRALRPKPCKLLLHPALARQVATGLRWRWSPEQVAGWLRRIHPDDTSRQVPHETIYRTLYIQSRGALKKELLAHLRRTRAMRRSRHHTQKTENHGRIVGAVSISERPATAADRAVPGHWEGDLVFGSHNSQIATLLSARRAT